MTPAERHELAKEIAQEIAECHAVCRLGLTEEQAGTLRGLADAAVATKKVAGFTAVGIIVTAFLSFFAWAVYEKIRGIK